VLGSAGAVSLLLALAGSQLKLPALRRLGRPWLVQMWQLFALGSVSGLVGLWRVLFFPEKEDMDGEDTPVNLSCSLSLSHLSLSTELTNAGRAR
jgi:hypothetical protein